MTTPAQVIIEQMAEAQGHIEIMNAINRFYKTIDARYTFRFAKPSLTDGENKAIFKWWTGKKTEGPMFTYEVLYKPGMDLYDLTMKYWADAYKMPTTSATIEGAYADMMVSPEMWRNLFEKVNRKHGKDADVGLNDHKGIKDLTGAGDYPPKADQSKWVPGNYEYLKKLRGCPNCGEGREHIQYIREWGACPDCHKYISKGGNYTPEPDPDRKERLMLQIKAGATTREEFEEIYGDLESYPAKELPKGCACRSETAKICPIHGKIYRSREELEADDYNPHSDPEPERLPALEDFSWHKHAKEASDKGHTENGWQFTLEWPTPGGEAWIWRLLADEEAEIYAMPYAAYYYDHKPQDELVAQFNYADHYHESEDLAIDLPPPGQFGWEKYLQLVRPYLAEMKGKALNLSQHSHAPEEDREHGDGYPSKPEGLVKIADRVLGVGPAKCPKCGAPEYETRWDHDTDSWTCRACGAMWTEASILGNNRELTHTMGDSPQAEKNFRTAVREYLKKNPIPGYEFYGVQDLSGSWTWGVPHKGWWIAATPYYDHDGALPIAAVHEDGEYIDLDLVTIPKGALTPSWYVETIRKAIANWKPTQPQTHKSFTKTQPSDNYLWNCPKCKQPFHSIEAKQQHIKECVLGSADEWKSVPTPTGQKGKPEWIKVEALPIDRREDVPVRIALAANHIEKGHPSDTFKVKILDTRITKGPYRHGGMEVVDVEFLTSGIPKGEIVDFDAVRYIFPEWAHGRIFHPAPLKPGKINFTCDKCGKKFDKGGLCPPGEVLCRDCSPPVERERIDSFEVVRNPDGTYWVKRLPYSTDMRKVATRDEALDYIEELKARDSMVEDKERVHSFNLGAKFEVVIDYGKPYSEYADTAEEVKAILFNLYKKLYEHLEEDIPHLEITVYNAEGDDKTAVFQPYMSELAERGILPGETYAPWPKQAITSSKKPLNELIEDIDAIFWDGYNNGYLGPREWKKLGELITALGKYKKAYIDFPRSVGGAPWQCDRCKAWKHDIERRNVGFQHAANMGREGQEEVNLCARCRDEMGA